MINQKSLHQQWLEKNFKKTVRYMYSDLCDELNGVYRVMSKEERGLLKKAIAEFKEICVDLYNELSEKGDFSGYEKMLDRKLLVRIEMHIVWLEGDRLSEEPDWVYNSYSINYEEYDFHLKEMAQDEFMAELAETRGWGYHNLQCFVKESWQNGDELPF